MRKTGKDILIDFQKRWLFMAWLEILIYAIGIGVLIWFLFLNWLFSGLGFAIGFMLFAFLKQPWDITLYKVSRFIDRQSLRLEDSCGLLLQKREQLSGLAQLQQQKMTEVLEIEAKHIQPKHQLKNAIITALVFTFIGGSIYFFGLNSYLSSEDSPIPKENQLVIKSTDSMAGEVEAPVLVKQQVSISYPAYTGLARSTSSRMDIKAVEGSRVWWSLSFEGSVDSVSIDSMDSKRPLKQNDNAYTGSLSLENSGFYNFRFTDTTGASYVSELYAIEVTRDKAPVIVIEDLKQFTSFDYDDSKQVEFKASITDDFGIAEAYIIATVTKGKGESVKFREEQLSFEESVRQGSKKINLSKSLDLDEMDMELGDELYFYVEARDLKSPTANVSRSETYFAKIKDTLDYGPGVDAGLGVDMMPDYFRSQRQLIIDTEKLISQRSTLSKEKFNSTSNDLGFDQKALRLKYGQFMGDETEGQMNVEAGSPEEANDPLAEYTHDHDGDNEHNLVDHDHEHDHGQETEGEEEDPLADYLHNHSDPESSTLFTDNLKSKLRKALDIMWDAELQLRLNAPEESLPFQYQALKLIQEIKNSARIYVHRIGFDPPPIKEEKRLSGDLDEVSNFRKKEELGLTDEYAFIRKSIVRLEELKISDLKLTTADRELFDKAGTELAELAIATPGQYLTTLKQLKRLVDEQSVEGEIIVEVQKGLTEALPKTSSKPGKREGGEGGLNELVLKALE